MTGVRERYRKLPGHRRGLMRGASVWIAGDHLLSVKSYRVREEYKRFQFRDVQAIVIAQCPRYHLSTRSMLIAFVWLWAFSIGIGLLPPAFSIAMGAIAVGLIIAWLYISSAQSCRCRILTAVSSDELPSVYRTWTARRFLAQVEPQIAAVQGTLVGNWFEAIDSATIGLSATPGGPAPGSAPVSGDPGAPLPQPAERRSYLLSSLFVALLFVNTVTMLGTLHSAVNLVTWLSSALLFVEIAGVAGIFVQHYRHVLPWGMQGLAIVTVIKVGVAYYAGIMIMSALTANTPGIDRSAVAILPPFILLRQVDAWADLALGVAGLAVLVLARSRDWK